MIKLYSVGGSGENGRNCHVIEWTEGAILFDCGVKRGIKDGKVGDYPNLTKELVGKIKFVLLSHAHEDHSAALPLLYSMGYKGKVYGSEPTVKNTPSFMKKWINFVENNHGELPFDNQCITEVNFESIKIGLNIIEGIEVRVGRSGHVLGGTWFEVYINGKKIFYSGDIVLEPMLLHNDKPSKCDAAIMNCAYAGKILKQEEQYDKLLKSIKDTLAGKGKVILPLPPNGRGCDIYKYISEKIQDTPLYVDKEIIDNYNVLMTMTEWIKKTEAKTDFSNVVVISTMEQREEVCKKQEAAIILTQDGMITTEQGKFYFERLKEDNKNKVIITGHAAKGTIGFEMFDEEYARENSINLQKDNVTFKVHFDDCDVVEFNKYTQAKVVVLFHADNEKTQKVIDEFSKLGTKAMCLLVDESYEI